MSTPNPLQPLRAEIANLPCAVPYFGDGGDVCSQHDVLLSSARQLQMGARNLRSGAILA